MNNPFCKTVGQSGVISNTRHNKTKFGAQLVSTSMTTPDRIDMLNNLGLDYTRFTLQISGLAPGFSHPVMDQYHAAPKSVLLNLSWSGQSLVNLPTDLTAYEAQLNVVMDELPNEELYVIENEELNRTYYLNADTDAYYNEIQVAASVIHARGKKLTNGGVPDLLLYYLVYKWLKTTSLSDANQFASVTLTPSQKVATDNNTLSADLNTRLAQLETNLTLYGTILDYINVHHYEVTNPNVDKASQIEVAKSVIYFCKRYIQENCGKPMIVQETAIRNNTRPELLTALLTDYDAQEIPYVIYFANVAGNSLNATPLYEDSAPYTLTPYGNAFKNFMTLP